MEGSPSNQCKQLYQSSVTREKHIFYALTCLLCSFFRPPLPTTWVYLSVCT